MLRIWCRWVTWQHFCCNCRVIVNGKLHCFGWWSHQLPMELKYQGFFLALHFMHTYKHVQIRHTIRATLVMKSYKEHLFPKNEKHANLTYTTMLGNSFHCQSHRIAHYKCADTGLAKMYNCFFLWIQFFGILYEFLILKLWEMVF